MSAEPEPTGEPVVEVNEKTGKTTGLITTAWSRWLRTLTGVLDASPQRLVRTPLVDQTASLGTTALALGILAAGLYRVSYYLRVTRAAGVSSDVTVTIGWTDGGIVCSEAGAFKNGNTVTTEENKTLVLRSDGGATPITVSTVYNSVGAPSMKYDIEIVCEVLPS